MKKIILTCFLLITNCQLLIAEVRYVSHNGSSTPPYTSWATAADSIQKCIDYSVDGDTIIVDNGVYKEKLKISRELTLLGLSMDSTFIDGRGLVGSGQDSLITIAVYENLEMHNFLVMGHIQNIIRSWNGSQMIITNCRLENAYTAIAFQYSTENYAENLIIKNVRVGIFAGDLTNTSSYYTKNNLILINARYGIGIFHSGGGTHEITNNIILFSEPEVRSEVGIYVSNGGKTIIKNNIVAGFRQWHFLQDFWSLDSTYIINNIFGFSSDDDPRPIMEIVDGSWKVIKNNIIARSKAEGIQVYNFFVTPDYNLYWDLQQRYVGNVIPGEKEIVADPMFVKDTIPNNELDFDYHLQKYSPAIDAGDPDILDVDGTRSDIGAYGGPGGESYTYQDLAPRHPVNLLADVENRTITLTWNRNTEADTAYYSVYRDTIMNFTIDSTKLISSQADTVYVQTIPGGVESLYYKVTAVDNQGNESLPSEEVEVLIISANDYRVKINDYLIYQNYPNPFNPSTRIGYKLKERGYVRVTVYDIKGELVKILVNEEKEAGYHEVEFSGERNNPFPGMALNAIASGIYLYRIEITGEGRIPKFSDMKKMILIK